MTEHATLRQLVGLADHPAALADSTLIMIDCQNRAGFRGRPSGRQPRRDLRPVAK